MTAPITTTDVRTGDPDLDGEQRYAHIAPRSEVMEALVTGTPVEALCGHVFVPSRDPSNYPRCSRCEDIMRNGDLDPGKVS